MATVFSDKLHSYKFIIKLTNYIGVRSVFVFLAEIKIVTAPTWININQVIKFCIWIFFYVLLFEIINDLRKSGTDNILIVLRKFGGFLLADLF